VTNDRVLKLISMAVVEAPMMGRRDRLDRSTVPAPCAITRGGRLIHSFSHADLPANAKESEYLKFRDHDWPREASPHGARTILLN
jgi:hypothetical protein